MLEKFGIYGWEGIEPVVLAAMVAKQPVLLIGTHGAAKTEGAVTLVKAVAGETAEIQKYDVPNLQAEEMLGYPNPSDLAAGREMTYISTPISIWGKKGLILDELNRANFMTQSKVVELVREGSIMGMSTGVEYVFAAVNPPESYGSMYLELALASRFVCVRVPDIGAFTDTKLTAILNSTISSTRNEKFIGLIERVRSASLPKKDIQQLQQITVKLAKLLHTKLATSVNTPGYSVRSMKMLYSLLNASEKLRRVSKDDYAKLITSTTLVDITLSTVPEVWGITQKTTPTDALTGSIKTLVVSFKLGDEVSAEIDIEDLLNKPIPQGEILQWGTDVVAKLNEINSELKLKRVSAQIVDMLASIPQSVQNSVLLAVLHGMRRMKILSLDYPLSDDGIQQMIQEAFDL